jgi:hypothetical protein
VNEGWDSTGYITFYSVFKLCFSMTPGCEHLDKKNQVRSDPSNRSICHELWGKWSQMSYPYLSTGQGGAVNEKKANRVKLIPLRINQSVEAFGTILLCALSKKFTNQSKTRRMMRNLTWPPVLKRRPRQPRERQQRFLAGECHREFVTKNRTSL